MSIRCKGASIKSSRQSGVALIIVVFVMALVTIIAAGIGTQQNYYVKKSINIFTQIQGNELAVSAEAFARQTLYKDWDEDKKDNKMVDHETEFWAEHAAAFPMELGLIEIQVDDLQGRFNINSVVKGDGSVNKDQVVRLQKLLDNLGIVDVNAEKIVDWVDTDPESYEYKGAEDDVYLGADTPYRTADGMIAHISELKLIQGMSDETFKLLAPHVSALPPDITKLNVNTCSKELLMTLKNEMAEDQAQALIDKRKEEPFEKVADFKQAPELAGQETIKNIGVSSEYFVASIRITVGDRITRLVSKLYRDSDGKIKTISRDYGQKNIITKKFLSL